MKKQRQFFPVRRFKASLILFSLILLAQLVLTQDADASLNESVTIISDVEDTRIQEMELISN